MAEEAGMDNFISHRKLTIEYDPVEPPGGTARLRRRQRGRVNLQELYDFYWKYYLKHRTRHGANKAAARHFGVAPSTISHHLQKLRASQWMRILLGRRKHNPRFGRPRRRGDARATLIQFFMAYYKRTRSTTGMKTAAAQEFSVTGPAISYHVRKIKADPSVPDHVKRLL